MIFVDEKTAGQIKGDSFYINDSYVAGVNIEGHLDIERCSMSAIQALKFSVFLRKEALNELNRIGK